MEIKSILFPTDFLQGAKEAIGYAAEFTKRYKARLYIIHVIHDVTKASGLYVPHVGMDEVLKSLYEEAEKEIKRVYLEELRGYDDIEYAVLRGIPYEEIVRFAEEKDIDMIVMASHGRRGLDRLFFGSVAEKVVKYAKCPVLIVKASEFSS